jgi:predicted alpha/beta-hydrolase family hydrolase
LVGGDGIVGIPDQATAAWTRDGSFLVRSSTLFRSRGFYTVIVDVPSDRRGGLGGFRGTQEHMTDIAAVIADVRLRTPGVPLWLIGSSNGTASAANVAARLAPPAGPDGLVLTATVPRPIIPPEGSGSVRRPPGLADIRVPTLLVHNRLDACTELAGAQALLSMFMNTPRLEMLLFSSPPGPEVSSCGLYGAHSFYGLEDQVVAAISAWID